MSEKSLFIQGILLTRISPLNQVRQSILHVLDEWAKVAPDIVGSAFGRSGWLSKIDRVCQLSPYAEDEWLRHRNQWPTEWRSSCGSPGGCGRWEFCIGDFQSSRCCQVAPAHPRARNALAGASRLKQPPVVDSHCRQVPLPLLTASMRSWGRSLCRGATRQTYTESRQIGES